jgi:hypothetical protein
LAIAELTTDMVLVQEDDILEEHVIYYFSRGMVGTKLNYSHVEKLSLSAMHDFEQFWNYIILRKNTIVAIVNLFQYVLTRRIIDGDISRCIVIL